MSATTIHPAWPGLLSWLLSHGMDTSSSALLVEPRRVDGAGYGLYTLALCPPASLLFSIPASALMNIRTLSSHYPNPNSLTAVQLISLHLYLHNLSGDQGLSRDPLFGPYISTLPRDFASHPLTWVVKGVLGIASLEDKELVSSIPPSIMYDLRELLKRFEADRSICNSYLIAHPFVLRSASSPPLGNASHDRMNFLWAWLSVNTRCIFHRLKVKESDPDNMSLCPILDFANHSSSCPSARPAVSEADIWGVSPKVYSCDFGLNSPPKCSIESGEQLFLQYGLHPNRILFTEYGFVEISNNRLPKENENLKEVDITHIMLDMFAKKGERGRWLEERLRESGYWGQWTLHQSPAPAHPSYRVKTALQLYCLFGTQHQAPKVTEQNLQCWRDTYLGKRNSVSEANEKAWRQVLLNVCDSLIKSARQRLDNVPIGKHEMGPSWYGWALENIRVVWQEELDVALAVAESVRAGEDFD